MVYRKLGKFSIFLGGNEIDFNRFKKPKKSVFYAVYGLGKIKKLKTDTKLKDIGSNASV